MIVTGEAERRINPETVRNVFLGLTMASSRSSAR
jgi:hypothetical protein